MNLNKIIALFISILMVVSSSPVKTLASSTELLQNGGFEMLDNSGNPSGWNANGGKFGEVFSINKTDAHSGSNALQIKNASGSVYVATAVTGLVSGSEYTFSAWLKQISGTNSAIKFECTYVKDGKTQFTTGPDQIDYKDVKMGEWTNQTTKFTLPADAQGVIILIRMFGAGEALWDDVSLSGEKKEGTAKPSSAETSATLSSKPTLSVGGDNIQLLNNGSFEALKPDGSPDGWNYNGSTFNEGFTIETKEVKDGKNALKVKSSGASIYASVAISGLVGGSEYELSGWFKNVSNSNSAIKIEATYVENGTTKYAQGPSQISLKDTKVGQWEQFSCKFTLVENGMGVVILLRMFGEGEALWDGLSFIGKGKAPAAVVVSTESKVNSGEKFAEGAINIFPNGGFEEVGENGSAKGWRAYKNAWQGPAEVSEEDPHGGKKCLKIETNESGYPWACMIVPDVEPGATYNISGWIKTNVNEGSPALKFEYYTINDIKGGYGATGGTSGSEQFETNTNGKWMHFSQKVEVAEGAKCIAVYARLYGKGTVYYDDFECYKTSSAWRIQLSTDNFFYYTEWEKGTATAHSNSYYPELENGTIDFRFKDGDKVLDEKLGVNLVNEYASYDFSTLLMTKKGYRYYIEATIRNGNGEIMEVTEEPVCRYDRPTLLNQDGIFMENGQPYDPLFIYHALSEDEGVCVEAGINLKQGYSDSRIQTKKMSRMESLDWAAANGIKIMFPLYAGNMKPAGAPENVKGTTAAINEAKNHPATFGYMLMDEPYNNDPHPEENMRNSYMLVRDLDPVHPIFTMENFYGNYEKVAKFTDILGIDPYPQGTKTPTTYVEYCMKIANEAVNFRKPVYCLLQTFDYGNYFPTQDETRNMIYQSFFEGAYGVGYYCFRNAFGDKNLNETNLWPTLVDFSKSEADDAFAYFVHKKYKTFNSGSTDSFSWRSFVKDGKIHMIVLNRLDKESVSAEIPLVSYTGTISINGYTAEPYAGGGIAAAGANSLNILLTPAQAAVYTITPNDPVDFSSLPTGKFIDIENYPWARNQIETLSDKGIVNHITPSFYCPGDNITRADFAMFLIRTLGITSDSTENFVDVNPDAYYAKELAAGKALGILNGVGENKFNPLDEISRQDMMTIIARGMKLAVLSVDLSGFSDSGLIAGYALDSVKVMIASGLIKGNADGTLNPLGNTTRAETAVIMYRIIND